VLNDALVELDRAVADLCRREITQEYLRQCDQQHRYPLEAMSALAAGGFSGMAVTQQYGGTGNSAVEIATVLIALARHSLTVAQAYYSLWVLGADAIARLGSPAQKSSWLPRIAQGRAAVAFALTEPNSGSDASAMETSARLVDGAYLVSGQKLFITGAAVADVIITVVRTGRSESPRDGLSLLLIDPKAPGVQVRKLEKMGIRALDLCEVFFDGTAVPKEDVLGAAGQAWPNLRAGFAAERTFLAAICVGALQELIVLCTEHATARQAFGKPIGHFQMLGQKIVDMRVAAQAARLLTLESAAAMDAGTPSMVDAAIAKLFASEAYVSATRDAVQVFGGYGFTEEYPVARHYRDAKYLEIGGGTSEIQRLVIGRDMGLM
jgi:alkylation response protein AidB-like acyl-CoA dehydrogenase